MRWFKHMTGAHNDESLCRMMDEFGLEGYGAFWIVLETIAAQCDKKDERSKTSLTLSIKNWRKIVPFAPQKLTKWLAFADQLTLFSVEISENLITVSCPKLLKYRDEYSERKAKKSGESREKVCPRTDTDTESETDINFKPSDVVADAPTPAGIPAGAREEQPDPTLTEEPQAETKAEDEPSPAPTPTPKPKRTHDDHRPKDCPPEAWKLYLQISRGFHTDKAEQLGARAPFSESKVIEGAKVMDTLIRLRGRTEDEVIAVLGWSTEDEFWSQNLRSMKALLKASRTNGELKYTNVLHAMDRAIERKIEREMAARAMQ